MERKNIFILLGTIAALGLAAIGESAARRGNDSRPAPSARVSAADEAKSAIKYADPSPKAGTLVLGRQPLDAARAEIARMTARDPLVATVVSFGRGDGEGVLLNVTLEKKGACEAVAFSGVAYGFDARRMPAKVNAGGEFYVAFSFERQAIRPGESRLISVPLHHVPLASLGVAHVDAVTCADGTHWARP